LTLYDGEGAEVDATTLEGQTAEYKLPADVAIKGKLAINLEVSDSVGGRGDAALELIPQSTLVTFSTDPPGVSITVDGTAYTEPTKIAYHSGAEANVWCPYETHLVVTEGEEESLHVFYQWSDGEKCAQMLCGTTPCCRRTYAVPDKDAELLCKYLPHGAAIAAVDESVNVGEYVPPDEAKNERNGGASGGCSATSSPQPLMAFVLVMVLLAILGTRKRQAPAKKLKSN